MLSVVIEDPAGYGRVLRDGAELEAASHGKSLADYEKQLEEGMASVQPATDEPSTPAH